MNKIMRINLYRGKVVTVSTPRPLYNEWVEWEKQEIKSEEKEKYFKRETRERESFFADTSWSLQAWSSYQLICMKTMALSEKRAGDSQENTRQRKIFKALRHSLFRLHSESFYTPFRGHYFRSFHSWNNEIFNLSETEIYVFNVPIKWDWIRAALLLLQ